MWRYLLPAAVLLAGVVNNLRQRGPDPSAPESVAINPETNTFHDHRALDGDTVDGWETVTMQEARRRGCEPCRHCYMVVDIEEVPGRV